MFTGRAGTRLATRLQCSRFWEFIQSGQLRADIDQRAAHASRHASSRRIGETAQLETGRLRIAQSEMGRELISELNSFEVDFTSAGNMRVDVRSKDHHGDLVIATALALWSAVGRPSGRVEVGRLENYW
jgi:hypothetical protein